MPSIVIEATEIFNEYMEHVANSILVENGIIKGLDARPGYASIKRIKGIITPGLVDAHLHLTGIGLELRSVNLRGSTSPVDVAKRLNSASGPVAFGRGFDEENFRGGGELSRRLLDEYIPDRPAIAVRVCGHLAVVNSMALAITGVDKVYPGLVDRERGVLVEDAVYYVINRVLEKLDVAELVGAAINYVYSQGVAGVSSMSCPPSEAKALAKFDRSGRLPLRVSCYPEPSDLESSINAAMKSGSRVEIVGVKLFADGSFGARTAYLREPYNDEPGTRGVELLKPKDIVEIGQNVLPRGFRLATHAIGDAALDNVLEAYESLKGLGVLRIEHASLVRGGVEKRLSALGAYVVVQPRFRVSDWWLPQRLGDRVRWAYRFSSLMGSGVRVAFSSDAPVEPVNPVETFRAAVGRCEGPLCGLTESLSVRDSLFAYTAVSSAASGGPVSRIGRLERGFEAVFTVWSGECCFGRASVLSSI